MSSETTNPATAYNEAVALLSQKGASNAEWGQAIAKLLEVQATGVTSAPLEANLARAYYKLENYPKAIEHFEKAIHIDRFNSSYRADLAMAQAKNPGNLATRIEHPAEWGAWVSSYIRPQEALFVSCFGFLLFLAFGLMKKKIKKLSWISAIIVFVLAISFSLFTYSGASIAIVTSLGDVSIRSAPLASAEEVMSIKPGSRLRILDQSGEFTEVERPNVFRGWISSDKIKSIQDL